MCRIEFAQQQGSVSIVAAERRPDSPMVTREIILSRLSELSSEHLFIFDSAIDTALDQINYQTESSFSPLVIAEQRDVEYSLTISPDLMTAKVHLVGRYGGKPLSSAELLALLKQHNVIKGLHKHQLHRVLSESISLQPGAKQSYVIASGRIPKNGKNSQFKALVKDPSERILRPEISHDGKADMRNLGELVTVEAKQPIMRRFPATKGEDGFNVIGERLQAKDGEETEFSVGKGTYISPDDPNILLAKQNGMPQRLPRGMQVDDVLQLSGVNVGTGNIEFNGSIIIDGDIAPEMRVTVSGSITVTGFVERATLQAGGDIAVAKGIIGRQQDSDQYMCHLESGGSVTSRFIQFADVKAKQDIKVVLYLLHSYSACEGVLSVSDESGRKGTLSGGVVYADGGIVVNSLGAVAGVPTQVNCLSKESDLNIKLQRAKEELLELDQKLSSIQDADYKLRKIVPAKQPPGLATKIEHSLKAFQQSIDKSNHHILSLQQELERQLVAVRIHISHNLYPGVECRIGEHAYVSNEEHPASTIMLVDGEIQRTLSR